MKTISEMDKNVYQGSWKSTEIKTLKELKITHVFNIGFEIKNKIDLVNYEYIESDDNSQSTEKMMKEGKKIIKKME